MCCEMKNLARDAYLYPHRKCVYKSATDPGGSALARAPPLDRGKDTRAPCYYDNGQERNSAKFQIITIKDTGAAACAMVSARDYYDNGHGGFIDPAPGVPLEDATAVASPSKIATLGWCKLTLKSQFARQLRSTSDIGNVRH